MKVQNFKLVPFLVILSFLLLFIFRCASEKDPPRSVIKNQDNPFYENVNFSHESVSEEEAFCLEEKLARALNIRTGPGTGYDIAGALSANEPVFKLEVTNDWAKISDGNEEFLGWINTRYLGHCQNEIQTESAAIKTSSHEQTEKTSDGSVDCFRGNNKYVFPIFSKERDQAVISTHPGEHELDYEKEAYDISSKSNTEVHIVAAEAGKVRFRDPDERFRKGGNVITIEHRDGKETQYLHLSSFAVNAGDCVEKGQIIGTMGATGNTTGRHLHFQLQYVPDDKYYDGYAITIEFE